MVINFLLSAYSGRKGNVARRVPHPPPVYGTASEGEKKPSKAASFQHETSSYYDYGSSVDTVPSAPSSTYDNQVY